jgi:hypothetical protein
MLCVVIQPGASGRSLKAPRKATDLGRDVVTEVPCFGKCQRHGCTTYQRNVVRLERNRSCPPAAGSAEKAPRSSSSSRSPLCSGKRLWPVGVGTPRVGAPGVWSRGGGGTALGPRPAGALASCSLAGSWPVPRPSRRRHSTAWGPGGKPRRMGVAWGWHGVSMGLAWGWHGVGMGLAWGWHGVGMGSTN